MAKKSAAKPRHATRLVHVPANPKAARAAKEMLRRYQKRETFLHYLAEFLAGVNQPRMELWLTSSTSEAVIVAGLWREMRATTPLTESSTVEDAMVILRAFLMPTDAKKAAR